jgi:hypothetical protein
LPVAMSVAIWMLAQIDEAERLRALVETEDHK